MPSGYVVDEAPPTSIVPARRLPGGDAAFDPALDRVAPRPRGALRLPLRDLVVHAFYNRRVILLAALLPVLIGTGLAITSAPRFQADAVLIVLIGRENTASDDITGSAPVSLSLSGLKEVASEIDIITSNDVIDQTLRTIGPATLLPSVGRGRFFGLLPPTPEADQVKAAEDWFRTRLHAAVQNETNVVRITFTHTDRDLAVRTLAALLDAYLAHRRQVYANTTSHYLSSELAGYTARLAALEQQIQAVKTQYGLLDITGDTTAAAARLDRIQSRRDDLAEQREAGRAEATATAAKLAAEPKTVFASRDLSNQTGNDDSRNALLRLRVERDHLATQYAPGYPPLAELDRKIASTNAAIATAQRTNSNTTRDIRNPTWDALNNQAIAAQLRVATLDQQLKEVEAQLAPAQQRAADLRVADSKLRDLQRQRDVLETSYRAFSTREAGARIDEDAALTRNSNVHVVQQPTAPLAGSSLRLNFVAAGLFGAVLLAAACAVLSTLMRNVYILPGEAERQLRIPVLADIQVAPKQFGSPAGVGQVASLAAMLLDISAETSHPAGIGAGAGRVNVFQFVGAEAGPATPLLVRALAAEFAVIHNLKTLLVDFGGDGHDHVAALGRGTGLAGAMGSNLALQATSIPTLFVALDAARSDLASSRTLLPQSRRIMDGLRGQFGMVLAIAPVRDVAAGAEMGDYAARRLSTLVDANLLVLQADLTRRTSSGELCASLLASGASVFGAVMVGARAYVPRFILRWL